MSNSMRHLPVKENIKFDTGATGNDTKNLMVSEFKKGR